MLKTNDVKFDMKVGSRKYVGLKHRRHYHFLYCKNGGLKILIKKWNGAYCEWCFGQKSKLALRIMRLILCKLCIPHYNFI